MNKVWTWLDGKKEILSLLIGALIMVLTGLGWAPDAIAPLKVIQQQIAAGDWSAALSVVSLAILALARAAKVAHDRKHAREALALREREVAATEAEAKKP